MYAELKQKVCTKCDITKEEKEFSARSGRPVGRASWCKSCLNKWRINHKSKNINLYTKYEHERGLKRNYKVTIDQYNKMLKDQNGLCACCNRPFSDFKRKPHIDHDHNTNQVRALLCTKCNPGLGYFEDSVEKLEMAIIYLNKFKKLG